MPNIRRRHSILGGEIRPPPKVLDSLRKKEGRAYEVYQILLGIMDTPFDAFVGLMIWCRQEGHGVL